MGKVKINLASGQLIEKSLVNAFKANNNEYIVLDNETIGQMGLPIILVSKIDNNKLVKIVEQNEWQIVKEYLKNIIAGNQIELIKVNKEMAADDIYYTQLTLPIPSFDALKNAYGSLADEMIDVVQTQNNNPESNNDINGNIMDTNNTSMSDINPINPTVNVENNENNSISPIDFITNMSTNDDMNIPSAETVVNNSVNQTSEVSNIDEFLKQEKDNFLVACENMFDALVEKLKNQYNK